MGSLSSATATGLLGNSVSLTTNGSTVSVPLSPSVGPVILTPNFLLARDLDQAVAKDNSPVLISRMV
jgi:hypothetical protein